MTSSRSLAGALVMATLCGCGSVDHIEPPEPGTGGGRYTLTGSVGVSEGLVLATGVKTTQSPAVGDADIYLRLSKVMSLGGGGGEPPFCPKGEGFEDVADVPDDASGCAWNVVSLAGNAAGAERSVGRDGYLTRDRAGSLYRLLIIEHSVVENPAEPGNVGSVTFDLLPVD